MMSNIINKLLSWQVLFAVIFIVGVAMRLWGLSISGIFFYDEALYLGHSLEGLEFLNHHPAAVKADLWQAINFYLHFPLSFTKPVWILIIDSRYFFTHIDDWNYAKYASAFFGILTLPLVFMFARKYFQSTAIALLSMLIFSVMPGPVFYSRIGLQEAICMFWVLAAFYCYLLPREFGVKTFLAGLFFGLAYLSNYRLIVLPVLLVVAELWLGVVNKEGLRLRHLVWTGVTLLAVMVLVGSSFGGIQMRYTFGWVFHQQDMSVHQKLLHVGERQWTEIFAYPYYLFRVESFFLALSFFGAVFFFIKRSWKLALPFVLAFSLMMIFSFASDRGLRYIAVILPFVAMSAAVVFWMLYEGMNHAVLKKILFVVLGVMVLGLVFKSISLVKGVSAYQASVEYIKQKGGDVKFLSSQQIVQRLYLKDRQDVKDIPFNFEDLCKYYAQGYRYLVLDPQAYIGFPGRDYKWTLPLASYLSFIDRQAEPVQSFAHFNPAIMERVVFEHSDNLFESIRFLNSKDLDKMSSLRVYDMRALVPVMMSVAKGRAATKASR